MPLAISLRADPNASDLHRLARRSQGVEQDPNGTPPQNDHNGLI